MNCDFYGLDNIVNYIRLSNLSKFEIYHMVQNENSQPLYSNYDCNTNDGAIIRFESLCKSLNPNTPYKITLFDNFKTTTDEYGNVKTAKSSSKKDKMVASFCLNNVFKGNSSEHTHTTTGLDTITLKNDIISELKKQDDENRILSEIKKLSERLDYLESDDDDDADMGADQNQLNQLMGLLGLLKKQPDASLNGDIETIEDEKTKLNNAIKKLYKNNKNLASDLTKLAEISETNPSMFNMLLNSLRNL
jgi:uncharacterized protein (UPF0335 family)